MRLALTALALSLVLGPSASAGEAYVRDPAVHGDRVYFTAEGDLWRAPLAGGQATRLTTHPGQEVRVSVSPDGKWLAFSASYEGPQEVYVMPADGGLPKRLTFSGLGATVLGWTPKGQVLFATQPDEGPIRATVVATVDPVTRVRTTLPLMDATEACLDPTGRILFFTRLGLHTTGDHARHYRGGAAATVWRYDLGTGQEAVQVPFDAPIHRPMVWKDRLIVVSDKGGVANLWSMTFDGRDARQLTHHQRFEVLGASLGEGRVAYQLGADLRVYDLATGEDRAVPLTLASDFDQERERVVRRPLAYLEGATLAPKGDRVVLTARGQVEVAGTEGLRRVAVDLPPGSRARAAVLSPDGKTVYAICDATGEQQVWRFPAGGGPGGEALTTDKGRSRVGLFLSPDGNTLALTDRDGNLDLLDLTTRTNRRIDANDLGAVPDVVWAPDGKILLILRENSRRHLGQILLHDVASGRQVALTSDKYESFEPAFTPDGKWLYFLSNRTFQVVNGAPWGDRNLGPYFDRRTKVYALALQAGERFPFAPKTELDGAEAAPKPEKEAKGKEAKAEPPTLDWTGLAGRLYEVPMPAGNYAALRTDGKRLYVLDREGKVRAVKALEIGNSGAPAETFAAGVTGFDLSADGKTVLLVKRGPAGPDFFLVPAGAKAPGDLGKLEVKLGDWSLLVSPREEWREMFLDAWRMHRDQFFDQHMRGLDWEAIRRKYEPFVDRVTDRAELTDLLGQMMGELGALHSQARPGDLRQGEDGSTQAYLGGVFSRRPDGYRLDHLYRTEAELPSEAGPLAATGLDVKEGDVLVAVNGRPTKDARDLSDLLRNQVGQQVLLTFTRDGKALKPVVVTAVDARRQMQLRYSDWEEGLRRRVAEASHGRIGYLHLRAMGPEDIDTFARDFYGQVDREGLILDVRRNNGGNIDSWVIEKLLRRVWMFWTDHKGRVGDTNMQQTFRGHLVVLADEGTYSDGETFTAGIKALHLGPVVGRRTAGAGAWLSDSNVLEDRGQLRAAEMPQYLAKDGAWIIEGVGVSPDVDVLNLPHETYEGRDRQLDTALRLLLDQLAKDPVKPLVPKGVPPMK